MRVVPLPVAAASLCIVLAACAPRTAQVSGEPEKSPEDRFRSDRYIVGRACVAVTGHPGADRLEADQRARAEVAKQLEVKVVQVAEEVQREEQKDEKRTASYRVSVQTREFVDETLKGVRIEDRQRLEDQGIQCSLAVLDRTAMAFQVRETIERDLKETGSQLAGARSARSMGNAAEALRAYSLAMLGAERLAVSGRILLGLGYGPPQGPSRADIQREWVATLEAIRLVPVWGEAQRAKPGAPLPEPFRVAALGLAGEPVPNLPLRVVRAPEGAQIQTGVKTDARGEAGFRAYRLVYSGKALEEVAIGIDWERLLSAEKREKHGEPPWARWEAREIVFTVRMPVPMDYRVGVAVFESGTGRPLKASPIQSSILEGLQRVGFRTLDLFSASSLQARPGPEQARDLLGGKADIVVFADVSWRFSSETSGFTFYRARGVLEGVALATGRTMVTVDEEAKGGGLSHEQALRKALANLAEMLREEIGPALEGVLD